MATNNPFGELNTEQRAVAIKIADTARQYNIDPELALAIGWQENHFRPGGTSTAGAIGPMQVMPFHAERFGLTKEELTNPDTNIDVGMQILKENLDSFNGNPRAAIVGYNAGPDVAKKFLSNKEHFDILPKETKNYLESVHKIRALTTPGYIAKVEAPQEEEGPFGKTEPLPSHLNETSLTNTSQDKSTIIDDIRDNPEITGAILGGTSGILERLHKFGKEVPKDVAKVVTEEVTKNAPKLSSVGGVGPIGVQNWARVVGGPGGETITEAAKNLHLSKNLKGGETLTPRGIILLPGEQERLDAELAQKQAEAEAKLQSRGARINRSLGRGMEAGKNLVRGAAKLMEKAAPLSTTASGFGVGMDINETVKRVKEGDIGGALLAGASGIANAAATQPFNPYVRGIGTLAAIPLNIADLMYSPNEERSIVKDYIKKKEQNKARGGSVLPEPAFPLSRKHVYFHRLKREMEKKKS